MNTHVRPLSPLLAAAILTALSLPVAAQVLPPVAPPDAGRLLQEQVPPPQPPRADTPLHIEAVPEATTAPGGAVALLGSVSFVGNTAIPSARLAAALGAVTGQRYDLAGLKALADRVSTYYRAHGYPFARAYLPPQELADGALRIEIIEGRHGAVRAIGKDPKLVAMATRFLAPLHSGDVIREDALEKATLLLSDQPGIKISPIIRPGTEVGTGDLDVYVERTARVSGDIGVDDQGNRYTGLNRVRGSLQFDSPLMAGDQIIVRGALSQAHLWLGSLAYSAPISDHGDRVNLSVAHTDYQLGKEFSNLEAHGTADVVSVGMSVPLLRTHRANLSLSMAFQTKALEDRKDLVDVAIKKHSSSLPITLSFDQRDGFMGGGVTYGAATLTFGSLHLDPQTTLQDSYSHTDTAGDWSKWGLDVARQQVLPRNLVLYGRASLQGAGRNLDSSEKFTLGGANGVRAFPSGEATGDEGWLLQLELRAPRGRYTPYLYQDLGNTRLNAHPGGILPNVLHNHRAIAGTGLGVRYDGERLALDGSLAWRTQGGKAQADRIDRTPLAWFLATWKF